MLEVNTLKISVQNMQSSNGNDVPNQFIIDVYDRSSGTSSIIFQSYNSIIAIKTNGQILLDSRYWDYSVTTGKYRNQFLGESKKETEAKIKSGVYQLANLNA